MQSISTFYLLTNILLIVSPCIGLAYTNNKRSKKALGSAANPLQKQRVAVFGGGGYLGGNIFGFLQRAGSIYGTGISAPKSIGATKFCAQTLNQVLGNNFKLAFAGEDSICITDMSSVVAIRERLINVDVDAVVMGTQYQLEERPVTANTYEGMNPNAKVMEFFLDERKGGAGRNDGDVNDVALHVGMFRNTVDACHQAGVKHVVVIEAPSTTEEVQESCVNILCEASSKSGFCFTYVRSLDELTQQKSGYTYETGVIGSLDINCTELLSSKKEDERTRIKDILVEWKKPLSDDGTTASRQTAREDLAAVVVQSLISLDWNKSRLLEVSTKNIAIQVEVAGQRKKNIRTDKEWCVRSDTIAAEIEKEL